MTNETKANPQSELPLRQRLWEFWRRNQIILLQLPIMLLFLFGSYAVLKALDPRIGVEGFGDLFGYALNGVRITLIIFTAWWIKKWCWFDLHDRTELELFQDTVDDDDWVKFWVVVRDRVEWVVVLGFSTYWYTL